MLRPAIRLGVAVLPAAQSYLTQLLDIMQAHSINRKTIEGPDSVRINGSSVPGVYADPVPPAVQVPDDIGYFSGS